MFSFSIGGLYYSFIKFSTISVLKRYFIEVLKFEEVQANDIVSSLFILYTNLGRFIGPLYGGISYDFLGSYFTFFFFFIVTFLLFIYFYIYTDERFLLYNNIQSVEILKQCTHESFLNQPAISNAEENLIIKIKPKIQRQKKYQTEITLHTIKYKEEYYFERYFYDFEERDTPGENTRPAAIKTKLNKKASDFD